MLFVNFVIYFVLFTCLWLTDKILQPLLYFSSFFSSSPPNNIELLLEPIESPSRDPIVDKCNQFIQKQSFIFNKILFWIYDNSKLLL